MMFSHLLRALFPTTSAGLAPSEQRIASTTQEQASDSPSRAAMPTLSEDAKYQLTVHAD